MGHLLCITAADQMTTEIRTDDYMPKAPRQCVNRKLSHACVVAYVGYHSELLYHKDMVLVWTLRGKGVRGLLCYKKDGGGKSGSRALVLFVCSDMSQ